MPSSPLRIALIAPLWYPVPPKAYGGVERVVALLADGLVKRGHDVTLFAAPGSETLAKQVHVTPMPLIEAGFSWDDTLWNARNIATAYAQANAGAFDVIHSHMDYWGIMLQALVHVPVVHTLHNPLRRDVPDAGLNSRVNVMREEGPRTNVVFLSEAAKTRVGMPFARADVVLNAVDTDHFAFSETPKDHFVWIARMHKSKGIENAIAAAEAAGVSLHIASRLDPDLEPYFEQAVRPHLNDKIKYVGEVAYTDLPKFYGEAKGLIYPIEWDEPFGLVVAEAMACGTPVIAYDRGSMRQLIEDGTSGMVLPPGDLEGVVEVVRTIDQIDRKGVRAYAERHFQADRMVGEYEAIYRSLL